MKMTNRKVAAMLILMVLAAGWSFAQEDFETEEQQTTSVAKPQDTMPMNTITVDLGPTIIGGIFGGVSSFIGEEGLSSSGFGIGVQYERQIFDSFSAGGRFAYLGGGFGMASETEENGVKINASLGLDFYSFSLEAHARFYPWARTFFLDGMLGYANLTAKFGGSIGGKMEGQKESLSIEFAASRSYFKLGAKIGWRIDFGRPGGFVFEPSFGYYGGIGLGDTLGKKLAKEIKSKFGDAAEIEDVEPLDEMFKILENIIFIGGPRLCLSFGWRF